MKETKWVLLALVATLALASFAMIACGDDDDDDDSGGGDDDSGAGSAVDACNAWVDECSMGLLPETYCDSYITTAEESDCANQAITDYFNCLSAADCTDTDAITTCGEALNTAYEGC